MADASIYFEAEILLAKSNPEAYDTTLLLMFEKIKETKVIGKLLKLDIMQVVMWNFGNLLLTWYMFFFNSWLLTEFQR